MKRLSNTHLLIVASVLGLLVLVLLGILFWPGQRSTTRTGESSSAPFLLRENEDFVAYNQLIIDTPTSNQTLLSIEDFPDLIEIGDGKKLNVRGHVFIQHAALSPDRQHVSIVTSAPGGSIGWIFNLSNRTLTPVTYSTDRAITHSTWNDKAGNYLVYNFENACDFKVVGIEKMSKNLESNGYYVSSLVDLNPSPSDCQYNFIGWHDGEIWFDQFEDQIYKKTLAFDPSGVDPYLRASWYYDEGTKSQVYFNYEMGIRLLFSLTTLDASTPSPKWESQTRYGDASFSLIDLGNDSLNIRRSRFDGEFPGDVLCEYLNAEACGSILAELASRGKYEIKIGRDLVQLRKLSFQNVDSDVFLEQYESRGDGLLIYYLVENGNLFKAESRYIERDEAEKILSTFKNITP